jgi:hypothetical protein
MNAFDYLAVLLSIVLGLGITQVLAGFAGMVRARGRTLMYWPVPLQMLVVFLIQVQVWWALFALRGMTHWSFAQYLIVLMQPVAVYMMAAFITPDFSGGAPVDLRAAYFREARWFFGALAATLLVSLAKNLIVDGALPKPTDMAGHIVFFAVAIWGMISRGDRAHKAIALLSLLIYATYVALLFVRLPGG